MKIKHFNKSFNKSFYKKKLFLKPIPFIIIFLITTCYLVFYFPPSYQISFYQYRISILYLFLASLFFFLYFTGMFVTRSKKHGSLIALFVIIYLIFRLNKLTDPLFLFLLIGLFLVMEFFFTKRSDKGL